MLILAVGMIIGAATLVKFSVLGGYPVNGNTSPSSSKRSHSGSPPEARITTVKVVRPKRDENAKITLERIATVEPYYRADLRARASGLVKAVHFDIGEQVKQGQTLIEIDVAEWEKEVAQKTALVGQRTIELKVSEAKQRDALAGREVTAATIRQKEAEVESIIATRDLKQRRVSRFRDLATRKTVTGNVLEEEERDLLATEAALRAAQANVERAKADHAESASKLEAAEADVDLKKAQIAVAEKDVERARVIADYGKVIAPFDGIVIRRNVDPGSFVQNATTGTSEALICLARIDLLTIVAQIPDNAAPFIHRGTPAIVNIADLGGMTVTTTVSRFSPSIQNSDRTMRVEVELFNGNPKQRQEFETSLRQSDLLDSDSVTNLPTAAFTEESKSGSRILPGMKGSVRLELGSGDGYVLPSTAVYSRSGAKYILVVVDGQAKQLPVLVHLNDGQEVRLSISGFSIHDSSSVAGEKKDLTGDELVVVANQLQVTDGAKVRAVVSEW